MDSQVELLHSRAKSLAVRFTQGDGSNYIDEAISLDREALELCPFGHHNRTIPLTLLAIHLWTRYKQLGGMEDLDEAIVLDREALQLCPQGHPDQLMSLNNLAVNLSTRYKQLGRMEDLDEAIVLGRKALQLCSEGHSDDSAFLNNLAVDLSTRYNQLGGVEDLDEAIVLDREALRLCLQGHPDRARSLNNLAVHLSSRYNQLGGMEDLDEAIALDREALQLCSQGHPDRSTSLNNLAICLSTRYKQLGGMEDLNEAIVLDREALELCPQGHPDRSTSLNNLANHLLTCYNRLGEMEDLNEAVVLGREALQLCSQGHPDRSMSLNNLAICLSICYNQLGRMEDLNEAIVLGREALQLCTHSHPDRSTSLNNLAVDLSTRYKQLGGMEDLDEAIMLDREALRLCPGGHPDRSAILNNLEVDLSTRHGQLGRMEDLDEAIVLGRKALQLRPQGHIDRPTSLNNLAVDLSTCYKQLGGVEDLDEAIVLDREALELCPQGHPDRVMSLNNLAAHLSTRYNQLRGMEDLDEAIVLDREALQFCPQGHPGRVRSLDNLASDLRTRFTQLSGSKDREELFNVYAELVHASPTVSSSDLSAVRTWIHTAEHFCHPSILLAYETYLRLLTEHLASLPSLPRHLSLVKKATSSLAVDAFSACLRNSAPARAVELLEQGRGVFWNQLTRLRSPLDEVIASGPAGKMLADEFSHLTSLIRDALDLPGADQHGRVCHLNMQLKTVVDNIRTSPGLARFLLPPSFSDLRLAASEGPVIIVNSSQYGCDALVVLADRDPVHIPLQITWEAVRELSDEIRTLAERAKRVDMTRDITYFLRELWDLVVSPIVDFLQTCIPAHSRIWWCPTAEFSTLPLHAAGPSRKGERGLPYLYVSSYTPTLGALIRARRHSPPNSCKRFVAVGQADAIGQSQLPCVSSELANVGQRVDALATFTRIEGPESSVSRVAEELRKNEWVHLACHGLANQKEPFTSAFALCDGPFTIERIIRCELENPEFAYLSACHTTVGDEESPDEVIHLASAMQFVGFRSVIGTMWAVDDGETNKIVSVFYSHVVDVRGRLDHTRAAYSLNRTMRTVSSPLDQRILYIHLGA